MGGNLFRVALGLSLLAGGVLAQNQQADDHRAQRAKEVLELLDAELVHVDLPLPGTDHQLIPLQTHGFNDVLVLRRQPRLTPGYQLIVDRGDGSLAIDRGPAPAIWRGSLAGQPGSIATATWSDDGMFARIELPDGESLWLEPLAGRVAEASPDEYALYSDDDVLASHLPCAVPVMAEDAGSSGSTSGATSGDGSSTSSAPGTASAGTLAVAEMAVDADYEYYQRYGSVSAVEARIHTVIDAVNLQYELEVGITHEVTTIIVRTSASQPYTSTDPNALLVQFRDHWNANHGGISRDVAHLFTGKEMDGSVIGIAYLNAVCSGSYAYGLSQSDFSGNFASVTDLTAHELGHNWGASHCTCTSYTMNPYITSSNSFEPSVTRPTIEAFRDSRSCLDTQTTDPPDPPPPVDPEINLSVGESGSAGTITAGTHLSTHDQDGSHEAIQEQSNGGKPANRRSQLVHDWTFDVAPGSSYAFFVDAYHTTNGEGDDFAFSYSRDGLSFHPMLTVTRTAPDDALQSYSFPEDVSGTLLVRAEDTDRTKGHGSKDTLYVDYMVVRTELDGDDTTPPATPAGLVAVAGDGSVALDWDDVDAADLAGYHVQRATSEAGPFAPVNPSILTASEWTDTSVTNGTTYHYTVTAADLSGNESAPSGSIQVTPDVGGGGPVSARVDSILVTAVNEGGGQKRGRADVRITDENGTPVASAIVVGTFSGSLSETVAVFTDLQGMAVPTTTDVKKGGFSLTFCVDDVTHPDLNYAPALNAETCAVR